MTYAQPKDELFSAGESLLSGEWATMNAADRRELIYSFCRGYILPPLSVSMATVYRARPNEGRKYFSHVHELMAPPSEHVKMGRLNRAKRSLLYIAATPQSAISEVNWELDDLVSIVACKMRDGSRPLLVAPLAMTKISPPRALGPVSETTKAGPLGSPHLGELLDRFGLNEQWNYQEKVLNHLITLEPSESIRQSLYKITNIIADHVLGHFPLLEAIQYPGTKMRLSTFNFAISQGRWGDIEACEVWVAKMDKASLGTYPAWPKLYTSKLKFRGLVQPDGCITYHQTDETIVSAWANFKQRRLPNFRPHIYTEPVLLRPFVRRRIRWDVDPRNYDFTMPEWP